MLGFSYGCCCVCLCRSTAQLPRREVRQLYKLEVWRVKAGRKSKDIRKLVSIAVHLQFHAIWRGFLEGGGGSMGAAAVGGNTACGAGLNGCGCACGCNPCSGCGGCGSCGCFPRNMQSRVDRWSMEDVDSQIGLRQSMREGKTKHMKRSRLGSNSGGEKWSKASSSIGNRRMRATAANGLTQCRSTRVILMRASERQ